MHRRNPPTGAESCERGGLRWRRRRRFSQHRTELQDPRGSERYGNKKDVFFKENFFVFCWMRGSIADWIVRAARNEAGASLSPD